MICSILTREPCVCVCVYTIFPDFQIFIQESGTLRTPRTNYMTDTAHQRNSTLATKLQKISGQTPPQHDKFHKLTHSRPGLPAALHFHDTGASTTAAFSAIHCRCGKKEWREEREERREDLQILLGDGAWSCENTGRDAGGFRHSDI